MAMVTDPFVSRYVDLLATLIEGEVTMLWGLKSKLQKLKETMETISSFLDDAEKKRTEEKSINLWLNKLRDVMYDASDIIDLCTIKKRKHSLLLDHRMPSCNLSVICQSPHHFFASILFAHNIGSRIEGLNQRLQSIATERSDLNLTIPNPDVPAIRYNTSRDTSQSVQLHTVGIEEATRSLVERLVLQERGGIRRKFPVFAILGMGGVGKTTLARQVYNEQRVKDSFPLRIWLCVTKNYSAADLLKQMIRMAGGDHGNAQSRAELETILTPLLSRKKIFLVLDDVWEDRVWEELLKNVVTTSEAAGGIILVTTRLEDVSMGMGAAQSHHVRQLRASDGWELLRKKVATDEDKEEEMESLKEIGMQFVEKCDGLPLAIHVIAGVLRRRARRRSEWRKVLESQAWLRGGELPQELKGALYLSYEDLPSHLKQCFLYFALFPEGFVYICKDLARLWIAEGFVIPQGNAFMEDTAEGYYEELVRRNILQPDPRYLDRSRCTIHDLLRTLALFLARDESLFGDSQRLNESRPLKLRRLSLASNQEETNEAIQIPEEVKGQECLRALMLYTGLHTKIVENDLFKELPHLRILDLSVTGIDRLPDSIGSLILLRHLDLSGTKITELPESISGLSSLQTLDLSKCECLQILPESIAQLCSLGCLRLVDTPVSHMPAGIGALQDINHLEGFVVGENQQGCSLEELGSLSKLRFLLVEKLERATTATVAAASALANKPHLTELLLHFSSTTPSTASNYQGFEDLSPPPSLESLKIKNFAGLRFPSWLLSSSLSNSLRNLTKVFLDCCSSCQQLPPLGQLPELRSLTIVGASAVVKIGSEFLGSGSRIAFPALEILKMFEMSSWVEWSMPGEGVIRFMPRLKQLGLKACPRLEALPEGLRHASDATTFELLHIEDADSLRAIENLPSSTKMIQICNNKSLESICNLPALTQLMIRDCPALEQVEGLGSLRFVHLIDRSADGIPEWLVEMFEVLQEFRLECNDHLFLRCIRDAGYWPEIHKVSVVSILTIYGCTGVLRYTKNPETYRCNLRAI